MADMRLLNSTDAPGRSRMSEELIEQLRLRVESKYYDDARVIEIIARAILHSRGLYI